MRIRTISARTSVSTDPRVWNLPRITFVSTCPNCGGERVQHSYARLVLFDLLKTRRKIDAYCVVCNVCWPITEGERREISRQMTARRQ